MYIKYIFTFTSQGGLDDAGAASVRAILHWQYRTICRGNNSILHNLFELLGPKTHEYISFYGLRAYGNLFAGGPLATSQVLFFFYWPTLMYANAISAFKI